jgi:hypothetical protein
MTEENKDQSQADASAEGASKAGGEGSDIASQLAELRRRQEESDRKVTELVNEKSMLERRLEEVQTVRQPMHQQVQQNSAFEKPFENIALGNTADGARDFEAALEQKAREMEMRINAQNEAKNRYESHISKVSSEKEIVKDFGEDLKMQAIVNFQKAAQQRKPISPEQAYDEAVAQLEKKLERFIPKKTDTPLPKGALGEKGGSGQNPDINPKKVDTGGESQADYLAARRERQLKLGM